MIYKVSKNEFGVLVCIPEHVLESELIDITALGDLYATFIDKQGRIHDCEKYNRDRIAQVLSSYA